MKDAAVIEGALDFFLDISDVGNSKSRQENTVAEVPRCHGGSGELLGHEI